jgi:hypothetical protein
LNRLLAACAPTSAAVVNEWRVYSFRALGHDRQGNTWLFARCGDAKDPPVEEARERSKIPEHLFVVTSKGSVERVLETLPHDPNFMVAGDGRVWLSCYENGVFCLRGKDITKITDEGQCIQGNVGWIWGEDAQGRVFFSNGFQTWAYHAGKPDVRKGLSVRLDTDQLMRVEMLQMDSEGSLWGMFNNTLRRSEGDWQDVGTPPDVLKVGGSYCFLPLKNKGMVLQLSPGCVVGYFDGEQWSTFKSINDLVETHYQDLARMIDNGQRGHDFNVKLRVDAQQRVWVVNGNAIAVYDGKTGIDLVASMREQKIRYNNKIEILLPLPGKNAMLAWFGGWQEISLEGQKVRVQPRPDMGSFASYNLNVTSSLWMDRKGRLFIPQKGAQEGSGACIMVDEKGARELRQTGCPRFADSRNRVYLADPATRMLTIVDPQGRSAATLVEGLSGMAFIREDAQGFMWISTHRGLFQLAVDDSQQALALRQVALYEKDIPTDRCYGMWIDAHQKLWWLGLGTNKRLLYRIVLPHPATSSAESMPAAP